MQVEARWYKSTLIHIAGAIRNRWVCCSCTGSKCEILLALDDEPDACLKEGLNALYVGREDAEVTEV